MKQRSRIYYTETDKSLMWDHWQQGESLNSIARLFDRQRAEELRLHLPALTKASNRVLTMADSDAIRIKGTVTLAGGRAFFVPAGFTKGAKHHE